MIWGGGDASRELLRVRSACAERVPVFTVRHQHTHLLRAALALFPVAAAYGVSSAWMAVVGQPHCVLACVCALSFPFKPVLWMSRS